MEGLLSTGLTPSSFYIHEDFPLYSFFVFSGVELLGLGLLVHSCCNPPQEEDGRGGGKLGW